MHHKRRKKGRNALSGCPFQLQQSGLAVFASMPLRSTGAPRMTSSVTAVSADDIKQHLHFASPGWRWHSANRWSQRARLYTTKYAIKQQNLPGG